MNRDEFLKSLIGTIQRLDDGDINSITAINNIYEFADAYLAAEIQRVCEVTPEMYSKVRQELGYYDNFKMAEIASGLTTALRERAKGE